jgi:hypothetical protein
MWAIDYWQLASTLAGTLLIGNHDLEYRSLLEMASLILAVRSAVRLATTEFLLDLARSLVNVADAQYQLSGRVCQRKWRQLKAENALIDLLVSILEMRGIEVAGFGFDDVTC